MSVRLVLVDDEALLRGALRLVCEGREDLEVVGEAGDGEEAVRVVAETEPDVVLMDVRMPRMNGVEATRRILAAHPRTRVLIVTTFDLDEYVYEALRAGAAGFLLKDSLPSDLVEAVRAAARGASIFAPSVAQRLVAEFSERTGRRAESAERVEALTERERRVLMLLARGRSNAEIGEALVITEATVKTHVSAVLRKLEVRDRVQAVIVAFEAGLVRLPGG